MRKIIGIIIFSVMCCGCTVEYNLEIGKDSLKENIKLVAPYNTDGIEELVNNNKYVYIDDQTIFYDKKVITDGNNYNITYDYTQNFSKLSSADIINRCFTDVDITNVDDVISISTSEEFGCIDMDDGVKTDSVVINITTKYKVLSNNADSVNGNTYTWNIDKTNYTNKPIEMEIRTKNTVQKIVEEATDSAVSQNMLIVCVSFGFILLVVIWFVIKKMRKNNKI